VSRNCCSPTRPSSSVPQHWQRACTRIRATAPASFRSCRPAGRQRPPGVGGRAYSKASGERCASAQRWPHAGLDAGRDRRPSSMRMAGRAAWCSVPT
jgi:hypothetical protein